MPDLPEEAERNLHDDFRRRRVRVAPPKALGDVMSQLLSRRGYAHVQAAASCESAWREAVGQKLAPFTRPGDVRRGTLQVTVANSSVLQELAFVKTQVVKRLAQLAPEHKIRSVKFRLGAID
jgi:predicted nucleic acid-binding Zn ribbon protein